MFDFLFGDSLYGHFTGYINLADAMLHSQLSAQQSIGMQAVQQFGFQQMSGMQAAPQSVLSQMNYDQNRGRFSFLMEEYHKAEAEKAARAWYVKTGEPFPPSMIDYK